MTSSKKLSRSCIALFVLAGVGCRDRATSTESAGSPASATPSAAPSTALDPAVLRETLATLAKNPEARIAKRKDRRGNDVHYVFAIDGVRDAALVVVDARPDAWSWSLYAPGLEPSALGALSELPRTPGGGQRWAVLDGPLAGAQIYRASNQDGLLVVESATWRDAHME